MGKRALAGLVMGILWGALVPLGVGALPAQIVRHGDQWTLLAGGQPWFIQGVTFGQDVKADTIDADLAEVASLGANTIRTWGVGPETGILLDAAQRHGLQVMVGLWLRHGKPGMEGDDSFAWAQDAAGREAQRKDVLAAVDRYKNHPALLLWGVGNEVILNIGPEADKHAYCRFLNELCLQIKAKDPAHPLASAGAWTIDAAYWAQEVPALDLWGCNVYGAGAGAIGAEVAKLTSGRPEAARPWVLTEFGPQGEWDVPKDAAGLPVEPSDRAKAATIADGWGRWLVGQPAGLGGFVFNFGDGFDHGAVWLSLKMHGLKRPAWWATRQAFTGAPPPADLVAIDDFVAPAAADPGSWVPASVTGPGPGAQVTFWFNQRTGTRAHKDALFPLETRPGTTGPEVRIPAVQGPIKVYALAEAGGSLAAATRSLVVGGPAPVAAPAPEAPRAGKTQTAVLPLVVYDDDPKLTGVEPPFVPSGLMGQMADLSLDPGSTDQPKVGATCLKVEFRASDGWVGCAWQSPANNWGTVNGGWNLTGAKRLTFWARSAVAGQKVNFGVGLLGTDVKFPDSAKAETGDVVLTTQWKKYTIPFLGKDLKRILTGFVFFTAAQGGPVKFYLDDIRFEG